MARALFWFAASSALVAGVALLLPNTEGLDETGLAGCGVMAAAIAALAITAYDALPRWSFHALVAAGSVVATAAIHYWGEGSLYGPMPYLWPTVYAFWFFNKRGRVRPGGADRRPVRRRAGGSRPRLHAGRRVGGHDPDARGYRSC